MHIIVFCCTELTQTLPLTYTFPLQTLDLRELSTDDNLVTSATAFHLRHCHNTAVLVHSEAFSYLYELKRIIFHDINLLTLQTNSIAFTTYSDALTISFLSVSKLNLRKNAINIQMEDYAQGMKLKIRHATIFSWKKSAVVGKIRELVMEELLFKLRPWPASIVCQGSEGAAVTMRSVTVKQGLSGSWITGNVSYLSITDSNLRLCPGAFAGFDTTNKPKLEVVLSGNNFLLPYLPSHALPSNGSVLNADRNYIVCQCQGLMWLREPPQNQFKESIKASLICRNRTVDSVLASCKG